MRQSEFVAALLDPSFPMPTGLIRPDGQTATQRFSVYRNNVIACLTAVLEAAFPVIRTLVGSEFFAAAAAVFVRAHPPKSRIMMLYGARFPDFLSAFEPASDYAYLPDVARLEQALRESYHAADVVAIAPDLLSAISEAVLMGSGLAFAPHVQLIRSAWPAHSIWKAQSQGGPAPQMRAEDVLILRAGYDPTACLLPQGGGDFLADLMAGSTLGAALSAQSDGFDLRPVLTLLLDGGAITGLRG